MDEYQNLRNLADGYAANGLYSLAVEHYQLAMAALPTSRFSTQQQAMLRPLLNLRLERAKKNLLTN